MKIDKAEEKYNNILPLINFENKQCGFKQQKLYERGRCN